MKAFILAAGKGTRLGELSNIRPKCLNDIGGSTMLEHLLIQIKSLGISEIIINVFHLGDQIVDFVAEYDPELDIKISEEPNLLGIVGGLQYAKELIEDDFILINSDIYTNFDLNKLIKKNTDSNALITLLTNSNISSPILLKDNNLVGIESKVGLNVIPESYDEKKGFAGIHVIKKEFLDLLQSYPSDDFLFKIYLDLVSKGYLINTIDIDKSTWIDMGTPEDLNNLRILRNTQLN